VPAAQKSHTEVRSLLLEGDPGCRSENHIEVCDTCIRVGLGLKFDLSVFLGPT
jgi:hypothetical protein